MLKKFDMDDGTIVVNTDRILWAATVVEQEGKILLTLDTSPERMSVVVHGTLDDLLA